MAGGVASERGYGCGWGCWERVWLLGEGMAGGGADGREYGWRWG